MRIGVIGAGQLGQMLGFAAHDLGHECLFLDPSDDPPASVAGKVIQAPFDDPAALAELARQCDVVTYEFENVPVEALAQIANIVPIYPPPEALGRAQDRLTEKRLFEEAGIPVPAYYAVNTLEDLQSAAAIIGMPLVLKTRRLGYDGKGQFVVRDAKDIDTAWNTLGGTALIAEQWINFDFEVSGIAARNVDGAVATYCLTRNRHAEGILRISSAPVEDDRLEKKAIGYLRGLLERLDYVGVLALELFVVGDELFANEFAPRVHNSGHWTIEGAETSQFRNHLLAITNDSPGPTTLRGHAGMVNLIGEIPDAVRPPPRGELHEYGKSPRPGRKLGHITVVADSAQERDALLETLTEYVTESSYQPGTGS